MTKAQFITAVQGKTGFGSIIQDNLAPDNLAGDVIEKRYLYINTVNTDGTAGKTYVYYTLDTQADVASFYNVAPDSFDTKGVSPDGAKLNALTAYLKANFNAYFIGRIDFANNWAEADVFTLTTGKLVKKAVIVFKQGANPITHLDVIIV